MAFPILLFLALVIIFVGQIVGQKESWNRFDAAYWSFITATTVGYGDIRPLKRVSKILAVLIAMTGLIFTGILVALALHAGTVAFNMHTDVDAVKTRIEGLRE